MPYANSQGLRIHYEVEGDGPPLVLMHGLSGSLMNWRLNGVVEALKDSYRMILVDARGHGGSDKPHDPEAYRFELRAADVVAVLDALDIQRSNYWGYSMGSRIGFNAAKYAPSRFQSFVLGGMSPSWSETDRATQGATRQRIAMGFDAMLANSEREGLLTPERKAIILANDLEALAAAVTASAVNPELEHILPEIDVPCLLYAGDIDPFGAGVAEAARRIPKATFFTVPGDHGAVGQATDLVSPRVKEFLDTL